MNPTGKEKILVALSDPTLADHLVYELSAEGYLPILATTGPQALSKMQEAQPDLCIVDLVLPEKNGYDVLTEKTLDRFLTKIPVIVVSNTGAAIEMRKIPSTSSIRDYVVRTHVDPEEIVQKVSTIFEHPYTPKSERAAPPAVRKDAKKVLWVEDDKLLGNILVKKFESAGHTIFKATNAEEALDILSREKPDVMLFDILLPGMSGFDLLQRVRMIGAFKKTPVIMLSNMNRQADIETAKDLGAQKFLVKAAVSLDQIIKEIEQLPKV